MVAGHAVGWPVPKGGSGALTRALASLFESLGGVIETDAPVASLEQLPARKATLLALTWGQVAAVAGEHFPGRHRAQLEAWRYGPGAFKIDWALDGPIPWQAPECELAGTLHLGGSLEEIAAAERAPWEGRVSDKPFVLLAQPSRFDGTRAPEGKHTAWAYCHVPNGWKNDATAAIEAQVERFAPGFGARVIARRIHGPAALQAWNANLVGGDINGGALTMYQTFGPNRWKLSPWATPVSNLYVCSGIDPTRRWRARDVWIPCGPSRTEAYVQDPLTLEGRPKSTVSPNSGLNDVHPRPPATRDPSIPADQHPTLTSPRFSLPHRSRLDPGSCCPVSSGRGWSVPSSEIREAANRTGGYLLVTWGYPRGVRKDVLVVGETTTAPRRSIGSGAGGYRPLWRRPCGTSRLSRIIPADRIRTYGMPLSRRATCPASLPRRGRRSKRRRVAGTWDAILTTGVRVKTGVTIGVGAAVLFCSCADAEPRRPTVGADAA